MHYFKLCDTCKDKPESYMCAGCKHNLRTIDNLKKELDEANKKTSGYFGHRPGCDCNKCDMVGYWDV